MRSPLPVLVLSSVFVLGGCGSGPDPEARPAPSTEARSTAVPSTTSSTPLPPTGGDRHAVPIEALAYLIAEPSTTTSSPAVVEPEAAGQPATTAPPSGSIPATTGGSGGAPVTTVAPGPPPDPSAIYQGVLGSLGADEPVVPAVVDPPVTVRGRLPLTGLEGDAPSRPAAVVKVDNGSAARPQTGLNAADIVVEEEVEGGITRFAAIFHSTDTIVGPVRSGRTTDIGVLMGLGSPLLMYSGANEVTDALLLERSNVANRSAARSSGYWRNRSRRAPSNLYTDTAPHWASAAGGPPPAQFAYRDPATPSTQGAPATDVTVAFRSNRAAWHWDGQSWLRSQGGRAHTVASGAQVSAANVVVIETQRVDTGMVDSSGAEVPEFVFVGSGPATVFTDGRRIEGTWTRPTLSSVATLTTADATVITLTPGRTWIELIQTGAGILS